MESDPLDHYDPTVAMDKVHRSQAQRRFVRKPNQVSGSYSWAAEIWWAALDTHPHRPPIKDGVIGVMISNLKGEYVNVCKTLWAVGAHSRLAKGCKYVKGKGFLYRGLRKIMLDNGREIQFLAGTQDGTAIEGVDFVAGFINEPPQQEKWGAFMARCSTHDGPLLMNFTPLGRIKWLQKIIDGDPETGEGPLTKWEQFLPQLTVEQCTTVGGRIIRTQASIDRQINDAKDAGAVRQRIHASWSGEVVNRRFGSFHSTTCIISELPLLSENRQIRLGLDHGEGPSKQQALLVVYDVINRSYYILGEAISKPNSGPRGVGQDIKDLLDSWSLSPFDVTAAFGDINSSGLLGGSEKYNQYIERGLAEVYGYAKPPIKIKSPFKGAGSVHSGETAINHAMGEGRFFVHESCTVLVDALQNYTGPKDAVYKDSIDALQSSIRDILSKDRMRGPVQIIGG